MENSITSNYVCDLVEKLLNKKSHETAVARKKWEDIFLVKHTKKKDRSWLSFIKSLILITLGEILNLTSEIYFNEENARRKKLSTKYVGNLKINISSDSSTHQQKAG